MSESTATLEKIDTTPKVHTDTNILNALDRCDRDTCKAAAFVKVILRVSDRLPEGGELMFCSHHYNKVETGLYPYLSEIFDERHKLVENKLIGNENS